MRWRARAGPALTVAAGLAVLVVGVPALREVQPLDRALALGVGLSFQLAGAWAWWRRPADRTGPLLALAGVLWSVSLLAEGTDPVLWTVGEVLGAAHAGVLAHLLLGYPGGRLTTPTARALTAAAYVDAVVVQAALLTVRQAACGCPRNLLLRWPDAGLAQALGTAQVWVGVALCLAVVAVLARRWHRAPVPSRRAATPLVVAGGAGVLVFALAIVLELTPGAGSVAVDRLYFLGLGAVPAGFLGGLLRTRLGHAAVAGLVVELGAAPPPAALRDALARGLGDPQLALAYWVPDQERYVDLDGRPVPRPGPGERRAATTVARDGRPIAALVHDAGLRDDPGLLDAVTAAAALALENARLQAELRARVAELAASRTRLVEAAESERRRIERNLHDGTQARLTSVSMALGLAASRLAEDPARARDLLEEARAGLATAVAELRGLSQGIHPAVLTERGLAVALRELAYAAPVPVELDVGLATRAPEPVEAAAYFVVAEALANVAKHAGATVARVRVRTGEGSLEVVVADDGRGGADPSGGSGLAGLADRVAALGGTLTVRSPAGAGTTLRAVLPTGAAAGP